MTARATYDGFAPAYDAFTASHDYGAWCRDLEALAVRAGLDGRRLLDVACGTGKSFEPFLGRYSITACDISPEMVALAAEKARGLASLFVCDMRALPRAGEFDMVQCLDDSLNYLADAGELAAALAGMRANLAPRGVVVFDVNTLATYASFFAQLHVVASEELVVVWRGCTSPGIGEGGQATANTQVLRRDGDGWTEAEQEHWQRHHPERVVRAAAREAGLRIAGRYGMTPDGAMAEELDERRHTKAVYVAVARR